ncbi:MAG: ATP-binding protein [Terracidiphilus sp.]|jgi:nitrogen fixation/metabolism regulation signal transduction histidine kinase
MAFETRSPRPARRAIRRAWLYSFLLGLPALIFLCVFIYRQQLDIVPALLLGTCLLIYLALAASALVDGFIRPLQTLSNVVSSIREGDYSFRARGASSADALGELAAEVNALADLLQKQRVRSLESAALLARMFEVMHTPLFAFDREKLLQIVNQAGIRLLGLPYFRSIGRSAQELGLERLLQAPDHSIHELGSGSTRWLLRKAAFRQDGVPHTLLLLADVSLPLQEEEQNAWKRLIRVLGHELSNSLAPIKSIAGSLLARVDSLPDDAQHDFRRGLGVVESRADALHRFVQSYRQLAQLPPPRFREVQLAPLIERVVHLEQRIPVELVPGPAAILNADSDQLEQMLINLLANAADASIANGAKPVRVTWKVNGAGVEIVIEDRGMGIANPENLFVPFYTTKSAGSGIGLALAQQIARAHGGEISLVNREGGEGARASIRLPMGPAPVRRAEPESRDVYPRA